MKALMMMFVLFALTLSASDVTGTWKASLKSKNGTIKRTFVFQQDGAKLTGKTTSDRWGTSKIKDGNIQGDTLSFTIEVDVEFGSVHVSFSGRVEGNVIKMRAEVPGGDKLDFTANRAT